ncbi:MAG: hypothetical protein ACREII_03020, partial [Nitrospiraceae bacterium]
MKRLFLLPAIVLLSSIGATSEGPYKLVMSKDEKLCNAVLSALNKDMTQYGEIRYGTHEATPVIPWHTMVELPSPLEDTECEQFRWAKFDVNNDGKQDLVVKYSNCLQGLLMDAVYFFESDYAGLKSVRTRQEFYRVLQNSGSSYQGGIKFDVYMLSELPETSEDPKAIGPNVVNPVRYKEVTFLHIDPLRQTLKKVLMHVVTKYAGEPLRAQESKKSEVPPHGQNPRGFQDMCYFRMQVQVFREVERL